VIQRRWNRVLPDGALLRADVRLPEGAPPRGVVVLVHGFKGFKDWAFFPWLAERMVEAGFASVVPNFSLNGIGGDPEAFTELEAFARNTLSREVMELSVVLDALADGSVLPVVPEVVGVLGHSRGGGDAVLVAAEAEGRVDALVTWAAVADFDRWSPELREEWRAEGRIHVLNGRTGQHMPLDVTLLEDFEANREALDVERAAARVEAPWLIVHGTDDTTVEVEDARRLARANPSARLHLVEGAGHTFGAVHPFAGAPRELAEAADHAIRHFRAHLAPARIGC
jgi:uncharacterized protein